MPINGATANVKRPLTSAELDAILAAIAGARSTADLLNQLVHSVFNALLAERGQSMESFGEDNKLNTTAFQIPTSQWQAIVGAATDRAQEWGTAATMTMDLINVMPSTYDDPEVAAPVVERVDRRAYFHALHVSREAVDVIAACDDRVITLRQYFGTRSEEYMEALHTWHRSLAGLFSMAFGAESRITRDGELSLFNSTSSGFVHGLIFHGTLRRCTIEGCHANIKDDGTTWTYSSTSPILEHEHVPSYPLDAPQPGTWSFHS